MTHPWRRPRKDSFVRLGDARIAVEEYRPLRRFGRPAGKRYLALLLFGLRGAGYYVRVLVVPRLSPTVRAEINQEAAIRLDRMIADGPDPDGWLRRSDGDYQLVLRQVELDPWLTKDRSI